MGRKFTWSTTHPFPTGRHWRLNFNSSSQGENHCCCDAGSFHGSEGGGAAGRREEKIVSIGDFLVPVLRPPEGVCRFPNNTVAIQCPLRTLSILKAAKHFFSGIKQNNVSCLKKGLDTWLQNKLITIQNKYDRTMMSINPYVITGSQ